MLKKINRNGVRFKWMTEAPPAINRFALLVPQFNEGSNCNLEKRLAYFANLSEKHKDEIDVILIDDGSTDGSLDRIVQFQERNPGRFYVASVAPNANKVGALFLASLSITHAFVILTDFDTDMGNLGRVSRLTDILERDHDLMGCYFRMLPHGGTGAVFEFQQMEYSLLRCLYTFHKKERSVTVMPGAGSLFKRDILNSIYSQHSGFRSGEDREATQIGHKLGYSALYVDDILALTRPPLSFKALIKQRIRWNLGYLETFLKEKGYYLKQALKCTRIGLRVCVDLFILFFLVFLPLLAILLGAIGFQSRLLVLSGIYFFCLGWNAYLLLRAPRETFEMGGKRIILLLCYPVMKLVVDYCSWMGAILKLFKALNKQIVA